MNHDSTCGLINITDRKTIELTGIMSVDSFDETLITLTVNCGTLTVEGEGLSITTLDLEKGVVSATGLVSGVYYSDSDTSGSNGIFTKLFNKGR